MEDNGRVYKEAYRTCRREYDTLVKKHDAAKRSSGVKAALIRLLPVLAAVMLILAALYYFMPRHRDLLGYLLPVAGLGLILGFSGYIVSLLFGRSAERDRQRMERLRSIVDELDEAWAEHDPVEAELRSINAERELRRTQRYSTSGIRERVLYGARSGEDGGDAV